MIAYEPSLCFPNTSHCRLLFSTELALTETPPPPPCCPFPSLATAECMCCLRAPSGGEAYPDLTWRLLYGARCAAGQRWPAQGSRVCLAASAGCLTDGVLETGAACRISSLLQAAAGSIFSPPSSHGLEGRVGRGGGGLSRRGELKVNVCRHNGEGLPPHGGEAHFGGARCICSSRLLPIAASYLCSLLLLQHSTFNILQKSVWWAQWGDEGLIESWSQGALKCVLFSTVHKATG